MAQNWVAPSNLGERIKHVRKMKGLSQADFAKRIGVRRAHISRVESGQASPSEQLIKLIGHEYSISLRWLTDGTGRMELNFAEYKARQRDIDYAEVRTKLEIFFHFNIAPYVMSLADWLEDYVGKENPDPLPLEILKLLRAIKEYCNFDRIITVIDKILAQYPESGFKE